MASNHPQHAHLTHAPQTTRTSPHAGHDAHPGNRHHVAHGRLQMPEMPSDPTIDDYNRLLADLEAFMIQCMEGGTKFVEVLACMENMKTIVDKLQGERGFKLDPRIRETLAAYEALMVIRQGQRSSPQVEKNFIQRCYNYIKSLPTLPIPGSITRAFSWSPPQEGVPGWSAPNPRAQTWGPSSSGGHDSQSHARHPAK